MFSGVIVFTLGKHKLPQVKHKTTKQTNKILLLYLGVGFAIPLLLILFHYNINGLLLAIFTVSVLGYLGFVLKNASQQTRSNVIRILGILLIVIIYTMFLGEGGATLNLFIERIIDRHFFGFLIPTAEFYALDPVFMLTIGPLIIALLAFLSKRKQSSFTFSKLTTALFCLGIGFLIFLLAAEHAKIHGHASALYIVLAYLIFPISELLLFPSALAAITKLAPKNLSAMMMGTFMLAQAIAGFFMGQVAKLGKINFALTNLSQLQHAAHIYSHFFAFATVILISCGIVLLLSKYLLQLVYEYH
jgi:POT family proton-dependent oligopeptide transporter